MVKTTEPPRGREAACMIEANGHTYCIDPLENALQVISKRWTLLVIGILGNHPGTRFSEAKRTIPGISARALSDVLGHLQHHGVATRTVDAHQSPPAVSYNLTPRGMELRQAIIPLLEWAGVEFDG